MDQLEEKWKKKGKRKSSILQDRLPHRQPPVLLRLLGTRRVRDLRLRLQMKRPRMSSPSRRNWNRRRRRPDASPLQPNRNSLARRGRDLEMTKVSVHLELSINPPMANLVSRFLVLAGLSDGQKRGLLQNEHKYIVSQVSK